MIELLRKLQLSTTLPAAGILAFSLCSTWSVYNLLTSFAQHPTPLFWIPAVLVEVVTAWAVAQVVAQIRELTRSNLAKQDRRFHSIILAAFGIVALPLLATSVWANFREFGNALLALVFPVSSITCAIGAALPNAVEAYRKRRAIERQAARDERKARRRDKEAERKLQEAKRQALEVAGETLRHFEEFPLATQSQAAEALSISVRTVRDHLKRLETAGLIRRDGTGVEVLTEQ